MREDFTICGPAEPMGRGMSRGGRTRCGQNMNCPKPTWPLSRSGSAWDSDRTGVAGQGQHQESSSCLSSSSLKSGKRSSSS